MNKKVYIRVLIGIALLIALLAYYIHNVNWVNTECMDSLDPLAQEIYVYRDAHGYWPENILAFSEDKKKTTRDITYLYHLQ